MGEDIPRYYRVRRKKKAFWEPGKFAAAYDLPKCQPLGDHGAEAKQTAIAWNAALDAARAAKKNQSQKPAPHYLPGSLGSFWLRFQNPQLNEAWAQMEPRTREDYFRAWPNIEKHKTANGIRFADLLISHITPQISERFHVEIHPAHDNKKRDPKGELKLSANEAHRTLKIWRTLLSALVSYRLLAPPAPIGRVANPAPAGRQSVWLHDEVLKLGDTAWGKMEMRGMAVAIRLAWDTMLAPVDVRELPRSGWRPNDQGGEICTSRAKTGANVWHAVTPDTAALIARYLEWLEGAGLILQPDEALIRRPDLKPYSRNRWEKHFRWVREKAFPNDQRQFLDLRRSAATEATLGGAGKEDLGKAMSNTLSENEALQSTYVVAASRRVLAAREVGRAAAAAKFRNAEK